MPRRTYALIDKSALLHNLKVLRQKAGQRFLWAVVKADAYGHGIRHLLDVFDAADGLAVLDLSEAEDIRKLGWTKPLLLIEGFFSAEDLRLVDELKLDTVVHSDWQIEFLEKYGFANPVKVHLKINSGMNRLGFLPKDAGEKIRRLNSIGNVEVADVVTHFANSELSDCPEGKVSVGMQLSRVEPAGRLTRRCYSNSGAILWHKEAGDNAVRAGIAMYGLSPSDEYSSEDLDLIPVMTLQAAILGVQEIGKGEAVGYGSKFVAEKPMRIGVVSCGYADGYPRQAKENREVWFNGRKLPVIGSISMDMLTIDLSDAPEARAGDKVELWGRNLSVNEVAARHNTIGYELLANLNWRVKRIYL